MFYCVNALRRAASISTNLYKIRKDISDVSMPSDGLHPFLLKMPMENRSIRRSVSMPSDGLHPFLPMSSILAGLILKGCQCPQTGCIHFYEQVTKVLWFSRHVSMPSDGLHPFLQMKEELVRYLEYQCQCPQTGCIHFY